MSHYVGDQGEFGVSCLAPFQSPQTSLLEMYCSLRQDKDDCLVFVSLSLPPYQHGNWTRGMKKVLKCEAAGWAEGWALQGVGSMCSELEENTAWLEVLLGH